MEKEEKSQDEAACVGRRDRIKKQCIVLKAVGIHACTLRGPPRGHFIPPLFVEAVECAWPGMEVQARENMKGQQRLLNSCTESVRRQTLCCCILY